MNYFCKLHHLTPKQALFCADKGLAPKLERNRAGEFGWLADNLTKFMEQKKLEWTKLSEKLGRRLDLSDVRILSSADIQQMMLAEDRQHDADK